MLDLRLLRAFVTVIETGSFTRAAERLGMTQSTISQQLGRLEEAVGHELVLRHGRPATPTLVGERLISYARRILALEAEAQSLLADPGNPVSIRIGMPDDLITTEMAAVFARFAEPRHGVRIDVTAGLSRELSQRYQAGEFDIVVVKEPASGAGHLASFREPMGWFESEDAGESWPEPLPLVTFPPGALYRDTMFQRIDQQGKYWRVAFSGSSLESVLVAVEAGLGISLLPEIVAADRRLRSYAAFGSEASMVVSIYAWDLAGGIGELVSRIKEILAGRRELLTPS